MTPPKLSAEARERIAAAQSKRWAKATPAPPPEPEPASPAARPRPSPPAAFDYESLVTCSPTDALTYLEAPMLTLTGVVNVTRNMLAQVERLSDELASVKKELLWTQR